MYVCENDMITDEYVLKALASTQRIIAKLADLNSSSVSRLFSKLSIEPINKTKEIGGKKLKYSISDIRKFFKDYYSEQFNSLLKKGKVLSFYNFKGGTGKTSICYQVSAHLALMGHDVLVIDGDPQGHLSTSFGLGDNYQQATLADIISGTADFKTAIMPVFEGLDCVPANLSLTKAEVILNDLPRREERIKMALEKVANKYDYIIFDTNPTISILNRNVLVCSDLICIVCETQPYSLSGLKILMEDMSRFYRNMQIKTPDILVIPNKYEDRSTNAAEAMTVLRQFYSEYIIPDFAIRKSEDIPTSAKLGLPLGFFARSNSIALEDVSDLIRFIQQRLII